MIYKGLDNEEANFLNFVAEQQAVGDAAKWHQEVEEVTAYRVSVCVCACVHSNLLSVLFHHFVYLWTTDCF